MGIKKISLLKRKPLLLIALGVSISILVSFFSLPLISNKVSAANCNDGTIIPAPIVPSSYPTYCANNGGFSAGVAGVSIVSAKWLHKGVVKVVVKDGAKNKALYFKYYDSTGSTWRFELVGGDGICDKGGVGDDHLKKRPFAYLSIDQNNPASATYLKFRKDSVTCIEEYDTLAKFAINTDNRSVFWQLDTAAGKKTIQTWQNNPDISFKQKPVTGDKSKWELYYERVNEAGLCGDAIGKLKGEDTWVLFPMMEWTDSNSKEWPYAQSAGSEGYHYLRTTKSKDTDGSYFKSCRVSSHRVPNVYKLGAFSYAEPPQELVPAADHRLRAGDTDGRNSPEQICGPEPESYDGGYTKVFDAPQYVDINGKIKEWDKSKDEYRWGWIDGTKAPSNGSNWLQECRRTDNASNDGDYAYHTLNIWDNRDYEMTGESENRLLDLSNENLTPWGWTGQDAGAPKDDGYKIGPRVAKVAAADKAGASGKVDVSIDAAPEDEVDGGDDEGTQCDIEGVGWIVCPILTFMGKLNDAAFDLVSKFLEIDAKLLSDNNSYVAWKNFRDLANALFVIAFLIIIYSQMTSAGISNYGIKKMMPRLIVTAVLVNASYILCQLAVDISNILGSSIYQFLSDVSIASGSTTTSTSGIMSFVQVTTLILAGAAALVVALLLLMSIGVATLLAVMMAVIILVARKAAVLLLVVVSPLAFIAYLLPNTEDWFKKWWKMFSTLLMVFPVIGLIFGASTLAARILANASSDVLLQLTALGVMAVPLFAVPIVLKAAMAATGAIGNKLSGLQDRANQGAKNRAVSGRAGDIGRNFKRKRAENEMKARAGNGRITRLGKRIPGRAGKIVSGAGGLGKRFDDSALGRKLGTDRGAASAYQIADKMDDEQVDNSAAYMNKLAVESGVDPAKHLAAELKSAIAAKDSVKARAAMKAMQGHTGGVSEIQKTLASAKPEDISGEFGSDLKKQVLANAGLYKSKDARLHHWAVGGSAGGGSLNRLDAAELTQSELGSQTGTALNESNLTDEQAKAILENKDAIVNSKEGTLSALRDRRDGVTTPK